MLFEVSNYTLGQEQPVTRCHGNRDDAAAALSGVDLSLQRQREAANRHPRGRRGRSQENGPGVANLFEPDSYFMGTES